MKDDIIRESSLSRPATTTNNHKKLKTINPATEEVLNQYELISKETLNDIVKKSKHAFLEEWKEKDIDKRADFLYAFAREFRKNKENLESKIIFLVIEALFNTISMS